MLLAGVSPGVKWTKRGSFEEERTTSTTRYNPHPFLERYGILGAARCVAISFISLLVHLVDLAWTVLTTLDLLVTGTVRIRTIWVWTVHEIRSLTFSATGLGWLLAGTWSGPDRHSVYQQVVRDFFRLVSPPLRTVLCALIPKFLRTYSGNI